MFQKTLFTEHLRVIAHANSSVPTKVLSTDHTLFVFLSFFLVITDNCSYGSLFRKYKNKDSTVYKNLFKN